VRTGKKVAAREEWHWSRACKSFKRTGVGTNSILERVNFRRKTRTVHNRISPEFTKVILWRVCSCGRTQIGPVLVRSARKQREARGGRRERERGGSVDGVCSCGSTQIGMRWEIHSILCVGEAITLTLTITITLTLTLTLTLTPKHQQEIHSSPSPSSRTCWCQHSRNPITHQQLHPCSFVRVRVRVRVRVTNRQLYPCSIRPMVNGNEPAPCAKQTFSGEGLIAEWQSSWLTPSAGHWALGVGQGHNGTTIC
jgi:hypothetical protein